MIKNFSYHISEDSCKICRRSSAAEQCKKTIGIFRGDLIIVITAARTDGKTNPEPPEPHQSLTAQMMPYYVISSYTSLMKVQTVHF